MRSGWT